MNAETGCIYETHMHTCQGSGCGKSFGRDYVQKYIDAGYSGIIITDHFYGSNCAVNHSLPWPEFINRFCAGYEDALNEGEKRSFSVFFGWEECFEGDEYLVYGLDKAWMISHPEMPTWMRRQQHDIVRAAGGCVVQAHPFRARSYNHTIFCLPALIDGIEGFNSRNEPVWNSLAMRYATVTGLPVTAGSYIHCADTMGTEKMSGVVFDKPFDSIHDYVSASLERQSIGLHLPFPLEDWTDAVKPDLPVKWLDENGRETDADIMDIFRRGL